MNIKTLLLLCCILTLPGLAPAADKRAEWAAARAKVEVLDMANIDLEAQHWAYRIDHGEFTYEKLKEYSENWIGSETFKDQLFVKIKEHLAKKPVPALSGEQHRTHNAYKEEVRRILSPGRYDQAAIAQVTPDYCIELSARYWARRVQRGEKKILELMRNWGFEDRQLKQRLLTRIEERVKLENAPLTDDESYKHEACGAVLK
jgi:hypothetical protein